MLLYQSTVGKYFHTKIYALHILDRHLPLFIFNVITVNFPCTQNKENLKIISPLSVKQRLGRTLHYYKPC